jgi:hypothetical protein
MNVTRAAATVDAIVAVQYPEMRERLIELLCAANDTDAQTKWLRDGCWFDDWFNDLDWLASEDLSELGVVLADKREATAIATVREHVNALFEDLGDSGYAAYRSDPRWLRVQEAVREALLVMQPPTARPG